MSAGLASKDKLFILRISTLATSKTIDDNSNDLCKELDRGWQIGSYENILADPVAGICHILIRLTTTLNIPATVPATPPAPPIPPPEKLFVVRTSLGAPTAIYTTLRTLDAEIDRGWIFECYEVVLTSPSDFSCFVLVKLKNSGNVPATIPGT